MIEADLRAAFGSHLGVTEVGVHLWGDTGDCALDDCAWKELVALICCGLLSRLLTGLELDGDRLIRALHKEPTIAC